MPFNFDILPDQETTLKTKKSPEAGFDFNLLPDKESIPASTTGFNFDLLPDKDPTPTIQKTIQPNLGASIAQRPRRSNSGGSQEPFIPNFQPPQDPVAPKPDLLKTMVDSGLETLKNAPILAGKSPKQVLKEQQVIGDLVERPVAALRALSKNAPIAKDLEKPSLSDLNPVNLGMKLGKGKTGQSIAEGLLDPEKYPPGTFAKALAESGVRPIIAKDLEKLSLSDINPVNLGLKLGASHPAEVIGTAAEAAGYIGVPEAIGRIVTAGKVKLLNQAIENFNTFVKSSGGREVKIPEAWVKYVARDRDISEIIGAYARSKNIKLKLPPGEASEAGAATNMPVLKKPPLGTKEKPLSGLIMPQKETVKTVILQPKTVPVEIPRFKGTEEAVTFGKTNAGKSEAVAGLEAKIAELQPQVDALKGKTDKESIQQGLNLAVEKQFYNEALSEAQKTPEVVKQEGDIVNKDTRVVKPDAERVMVTKPVTTANVNRYQDLLNKAHDITSEEFAKEAIKIDGLDQIKEDIATSQVKSILKIPREKAIELLKDVPRTEGSMPAFEVEKIIHREFTKEPELTPTTDTPQSGVYAPRTGSDARFRDENKIQNVEPAKTPGELSKRIEQLNKFAQTRAILRRGAKLGGGGISKSGKAGVFQHGPRIEKEGLIKIDDDVLLNDQQYMPTLGHELGHAIEHNVLGKTGDRRHRLFGENLDAATLQTLRNELAAVTEDLVGKEAMKAKPAYYFNPAELTARFFEKMIASPASLDEIAPTASKLFEAQSVKHPMMGEFLEAARGAIDKGFHKNKLFPDMRQSYQNALGKRAGDMAYDRQITYRAMKERAKVVIERFVKEKFKNIKDDPETLFRAAESIKVSRGGVPEFGTRDFSVAEKPEDRALLFQNGYKPLLDDTGKPVTELIDGAEKPRFFKSRYTEQEAKKIFDSLSPEGKKLIMDFTSKRKDAKDYFNREVIKDVHKINGQIEGWVHHFFEPKDAVGDVMGFAAKLKKKKAGSRKYRSGEEGYVMDFQKSMTKAMTELEIERAFNNFIPKFLANVTKPLAKGQPPQAGWVEVVGNLKSGVRRPQEKTTIIIDKESGKQFVANEARYQMPKDIYKQYEAWRGIVHEASIATQIAGNVIRYGNINLLAHPGTAATNAIGGGLFYTEKIIKDFYTELLTGSLTMPQTRRNASAMVKALLPKGWFEAPDWIYGNDLSNYYGQFGQEQKALLSTAVKEWGDKGLKLFGTIERYWKKVIMTAENVSDLSRLNQVGPEGLALPTPEEEATIADLNREIDLFALDYDNVPEWLTAHSRSVVGQAIKPFAKYPYKYAKKILDTIGSAFDNSKSISDRIAAIMALSTLVGVYAAISLDRKKKQTTPEASQGTEIPARYQTRGRLFVGTDAQGRELFTRTAKYPYFGLTEAAIQLAHGNMEAANDNVSDMLGSIGPIGKVGLLAFGSRSKYDQYTPAPIIVGDSLSTYLVPFSRVLNDVSRMLDPYQRKEETVSQSFTRLIPTTDADLQEKLHGKIRTERVPIEGGVSGSRWPSGTRTTIDRELENNWQDIALSLLSGVYVTRLDPKIVDAFRIRAEKNQAKRAVKNK